MLLFVALAAVVCSAWAAQLPVDHPAWTDRYDAHFRKYGKRYFGVLFDWRWFKAQAIAESGLRPTARSRKGAVGIMQILPSTFAEIRERHPYLYELSEPRWNIAAGIAFDRALYDRWQERVPARQTLPFTFASYNAGFSRVLRARDMAAASDLNADQWSHVHRHVPDQTRSYVKKINALMGHELAIH